MDRFFELVSPNHVRPAEEIALHELVVEIGVLTEGQLMCLCEQVFDGDTSVAEYDVDDDPVRGTLLRLKSKRPLSIDLDEVRARGAALDAAWARESPELLQREPFATENEVWGPYRTLHDTLRTVSERQRARDALRDHG